MYLYYVSHSLGENRRRRNVSERTPFSHDIEAVQANIHRYNDEIYLFLSKAIQYNNYI